jgi:hypothetical protein
MINFAARRENISRMPANEAGASMPKAAKKQRYWARREWDIEIGARLRQSEKRLSFWRGRKRTSF